MNAIRRSSAAVLVAVIAGAWIPGALSQEDPEANSGMYRPMHAAPGGLSPRPFLHTLIKEGGNLTLEWQGLTPPYQVEATTSLTDPDWQMVGDPVAGNSLTVPADGDLAFFRVDGGNPYYVGALVCGACHRGTHADWSETHHAKALDTLKNIGMDKNARCLECHVVGLGLPTGFVSAAQTPHLGGVQCENCHGPGGLHMSNVRDEALQPKVTLAAETCGGCHTDAHHPTYDEWLDSRHAVMDEHVGEGFITGGEARMAQCGACHSGAVRMAMLSHWKELQEDANAQISYPTGEDAAYFTIECAVCHNAHENTQYAQLRNPRKSLQDFSYNTSTSTSFAEQYDPEVQLCAQCHNMRGATWSSSSRPPHHSPQYNVLIGRGGVDPEDQQILRAHSMIDEQCASCHTHGHEAEHPSDADPNYTGHTFRPTFVGCVDCHGSEEVAELLAEGTMMATKNRMAGLVEMLNDWALTKAPEELRTKYGTLAWEFTNVGQISNPDGTVGPGPSSAEQGMIPDGIKQARFNLYLIEHDASYGVHNGAYARRLIDIGKNLVQTELDMP